MCDPIGAYARVLAKTVGLSRFVGPVSQSPHLTLHAPFNPTRSANALVDGGSLAPSEEV